MTLTSEQKDHAIQLVEMGDTLEAVRYLQETLQITADQALALTEKLKEEVDASPLLDEFKAMEEQLRQKPGINIGRIVGLIFMSVGGILLSVVVYFVISNYQFEQRAVPVMGKIIDYESYLSKNDNGGSTTMYTPIFQYTFNGKEYTYKSSTSSSSRGYEIGESVEVLVDPDEPLSVLIHSFWDEWFLSILLGIMGTMFAGMGYMAYRVLGRPTQND